MKKVITAGVAAGSLVLTATASVAATNTQKMHQRKWPASVGMNSAAVEPVTYGGCRAKHGVDTIGYHGCLQYLPASALVGGR